MEKFIYLDWNVIQYCKNPRKNSEIDKEFLTLINALKCKYRFPFTEGQLLDLSASSKDGKIDNNIREDLNFLNKISDGLALCYNNYMDPQLVKKDMDIEFYKILDERNEKLVTKMVPDFPPIKIDLSRMNRNDLFFKFIYENDGYLTSDVLNNAMQYMTDIFDDNEKYKKFRSEAMHLKDTMLNREDMVLCKGTVLHDLIINYLSFYEINDILELEKKFTGFLKQQFSLRGRDYKISPVKEKIEVGIMLLDFNPIFSEKINKTRNKLLNMTRDCKHICMASDAEYFITEDKSIYNKGQFIYKTLNIKTKIKKMSELYYMFS
jgi:hypothetical protein